MKKRIAIAVGLGLLSFGIGLGAMYAFMPDVDPEKVGRTKLQLDSLGLISVPDRDSLAQVFATKDSLARDMLSPAVEEATAEAEPALADSIASSLSRLAALRAERDELLERVQALEEQLQIKQDAGERIENLSSTLSKVDNRQLAAILETVSLEVMAVLYNKASVRNRTKLLQALPAQRAAHFIHAMVGAPPPPTPEREPEKPAAGPEDTAAQPE